MKNVDVIIAGLGPTGATLAGLLGQRGIRVAVFDRMPGLFPQPRAIGLDHEAMRIVQELGAADLVAPHIAPYRPSEYWGVDGELIKRLDTIPQPYPLAWAPNYVFSQPGFEGALRQRLAELDTVQIHCEAEVVDSGQDDDGVWVEVKGPGEVSNRYTAHYLVACDGGNSPTRKRLGIEMEDLGFDERWLTIDAIVIDEKLADLPQTQVQFCNASRPGSYLVGPGNHRRWEVQLLPSDSQATQFSEEEIWPLLSRWIKPGEARLWRSASYRFHGLVAREWRRQRILLAGDAAHMTPPFMAQGMCQGLRDGLNLAWKLERVIRGQSPDELLDSYMQERRPHVVQTTQTSIELGRLICETDLEAAKARDKRLRDEQGGTIKTAFRQQMIPNLLHGLCDFSTPGAGQLFPQPEVSSRNFAGKLDDLTGRNVRVVVCGELSETDSAQYLDALQRVGGVLIQVTDTPNALPGVTICEQHNLIKNWLQGLSACVAVVRPDHYVYGTAAKHGEALAMLNALDRRLRGKVQPLNGRLPDAKTLPATWPV